MKRIPCKSKAKSPLHASIPNIVVIGLSFVLLIGATLALASRVITSSNNSIATGTFGVTFNLLKPNAENLEIEESWSVIEDDTAIFRCSNWQQTSTGVEVIRVQNTGTVPIKWKAAVVPADGQATADAADLAAVIDVFFDNVTDIPEVSTDGDTGVTTCDLTDWTRVGTLRQLLAGEVDWPAHILGGETTSYVAIALQMQADAGTEYLGLSESFTIKLLAVQAMATDDQWPEADGEAGAQDPSDVIDPQETTAAPETTIEPGTTIEPETTTEPETTIESETTAASVVTPTEPTDPNVFLAAEEGLPAGTLLNEHTNLGGRFKVTCSGDGKAHLASAAEYQLLSGELRATTTESYALSITPTDFSEFKLFVRSHGVESMLGTENWSEDNWAGDGIQIGVKKISSGYRLNITYTTYTDGEIVARKVPVDTGLEGTVTIADDGNTVYILVDNTICTTIRLSGTVRYDAFAEKDFSKTADIVYMNGMSEQVSDTAIAPSTSAQCGIATDSDVAFRMIALQSYDTVREIIEANQTPAGS